MKKWIVALVSLSAILCGCEKEADQPKPDPPAPVVDTILTTDILLRKWEITHLSVNKYRGDTLRSTSVWEKGVGYIADGQQMQRWGENYVTYITFRNDNTFTHENKDGVLNGYMLDGVFAPNGTWNLLDPKALQLSTMRDTFPTQDVWRVTYKDSTIVTTLLFSEPAINPLDTTVAHVLFELPRD